MRNHGLLFFFGSVLLSAVLYAQGRDNSFLDDDYIFLHHVSTATSMTELLQPNNNFAFYRPGALCIFRLEYALFAEDSGKYLLFNYGIHIINTLVFLLLLQRLSICRTRALFAASLFLIGVGHYGKEVLWACTSGGLFAVTLSLAACWLLSDSSPSRLGGVNRIHSVMLATGCVFAAVTCHEGALVTPFLAVLFLRARRRSIRPALPLVLAAFLWLVLLAVTRQAHPAYQASIPRTLASPVYLFRYPGFMLLPIQPEQIAAVLPVQLFLSSAVLIGALVLFHRAEQPGGLLAAWLYMVLVPYTLVDVPGWWLDMRYTYFAAMPFCALVVLAVASVFKKSPGSIRVGTAVCLAFWVCAAVAFEFHLEHRCDEISRNSTHGRFSVPSSRVGEQAHPPSAEGGSKNAGPTERVPMGHQPNGLRNLRGA